MRPSLKDIALDALTDCIIPLPKDAAELLSRLGTRRILFMIPSAPPSTDAAPQPKVASARVDDTPVDFSLNRPVQFTLLEAERHLLDQFAQEQFLLLRQAREQLLGDKKA